jgi:hypothetical protein
MRKLTVKYEGKCAKCGATLEIGQPAMYEKRTGIFCVGCEPTDTEEIRHYRQIKADAKADRYENWASKREIKAKADLNSYPSMRHDCAFITQPGHIPARTRMNCADDRAMKSLQVADELREKANNLRHVQVAGDAERKRQRTREKLDSILKVNSRVHDFSLGDGTITKVCKKSYRIQFDRNFTCLIDKSYVIPLKV